MGEIADAMLEGDLCCQCGVFLEEEDNPIDGIPCLCNDCKKENKKENKNGN